MHHDPRAWSVNAICALCNVRVHFCVGHCWQNTCGYQEGMMIIRCGSLKFVHCEITLDLLSDHIWFLQRARQRNELKLHELDSLS